ncbi:hypothetical protein DPMN_069909 [Dreissena polymorpha]|uniref:Uncharacterized protein n=1 Tax=Dreissena polymorpha TaxID=45954 RepID=A0A9D3Z0E2_DREPO|nr:hypothetical protein DPMN_069909 [Dreissena polymorpha]
MKLTNKTLWKHVNDMKLAANKFRSSKQTNALRKMKLKEALDGQDPYQKPKHVISNSHRFKLRQLL